MQEAKVVEIRARPNADAVALTEARVAAAKPRVARCVLADAKVRGLVVRIEPSGVKSWFVRGRIGPGPSGTVGVDLDRRRDAGATRGGRRCRRSRVPGFPCPPSGQA